MTGPEQEESNGQQSGGVDHFVTVRSVQVWNGGLSADMVDDDGNLTETAKDLEFQKEKSLSFECACGQRFQQWDTAADHLNSVDTGVDR